MIFEAIDGRRRTARTFGMDFGRSIELVLVSLSLNVCT